MSAPMASTPTPAGKTTLRVARSRKRVTHLLVFALLVWLGKTLAAGPRFQPPGGLQPAGKAGIVKAEFIYEKAPFASCHASTIAETRSGLVAAWFGGKHEKSSDVGIWLSRRNAKGWSPVAEVANGAMENGERYPAWNPVLFEPREGLLLLFYKVGPNPRAWWGMLITSSDEGRTWSKPRRLPENILGPTKNKPIQLRDGSILCPSSSEHPLWTVHVERTSDLGKTWQHTAPLNDGKQFAAIQPTILAYPSGRIQILCRSRQGRITESWSEDEGKTWSRMQATELPNPNSGIDAVMLKDGRALLVYNHTDKDRSALSVAVSADGKNWKAAMLLEDDPGEYSYPAVIQTSDGLVHITYTWKRERIKHVVLDPKELELRDLPGTRAPT
jgi:predicted neuraminidase